MKLKLIMPRFLLFCMLLQLLPAMGRAAPTPLEEYREHGVTIVSSPEFQPIYFRNNEGKPVGLLVDYWKKWSEKTGIPVRFKAAPWKETMEMVIKGQADIHAGLVNMPERRALLDFSDPIMPVTTMLIVKGEDSHISKKRIYAGGTVGVISKSHPVTFFRNIYPSVKLHIFDNHKQLMDALAEDRLDAIVMDYPSFRFQNAKRETPIQAGISDILTTVLLHAGVGKGNETLLWIINDGFSKIKDSERERLKSRWFITEVHGHDWPTILAWASAIACAMGIALFFLFQIKPGHTLQKK
ncbi:transporter substrate-binding domain-containing protein [Pseudodesulfovibrio piezophilus]|uniref:Solute-binding protein family 3/N-terminal domain-containing protein n=1 Tax=Pseudodesulfovibrio piezophilus (strain DSM 21447 / JCM 15486 / C1TLV30) TaxID=1322246 RepID=M1WW79_PSEP2|nr:transporter substrate-binding domain-containing protein [Pseudodesulfovibrio piezophilus]CCH48983.1 exported protein of unknown function [Pseudodesulfovibrio piezophilus C1TLV30]